jgi:hypothetical protein
MSRRRRLALILQGSLEVFCGKIRVFAKPPNDGFVVGNTGFAFHEVPLRRYSSDDFKIA